MKTRSITIILICFIVFIAKIKAQEKSKIELKDKFGNLTTVFYYSIFNGDTLNNGSYINYYPNGKIKDSCFFEKGIVIGLEKFYDKHGRITYIHEYVGETFPRVIKTKAFYYKGVCRYAEGNMLEIEQGNAVNHGFIKYYWKNMQVMDSVIYNYDKKIYRARFNKKGKLKLEIKY